jgi:hypothetical protein
MPSSIFAEESLLPLSLLSSAEAADSGRGSELFLLGKLGGMDFTLTAAISAVDPAE